MPPKPTDPKNSLPGHHPDSGERDLIPYAQGHAPPRQTHNHTKTLLAAATTTLLLTLGYLWLRAATNSYDQRFTDCMRTTQSQLYPAGHYFPDNDYNEAMRECEHRAGLPATQTTPIHPSEVGP